MLSSTSYLEIGSLDANGCLEWRGIDGRDVEGAEMAAVIVARYSLLFIVL